MAGPGDAEPLAPHDAWLRARARWPQIDLDEATYRSFLEARDPSVAATSGDDLYLACACARGDESAIRAFEETYFDEIDAVLRKERKLNLKDELVQQLRVKLFLARDGRAPAIGSYSGRGPVRRWLRMTSARALINLTTRRGREVPTSDDFIADMLGGDADPELEIIKKTYRRSFQAAFSACFAALDETDKGLLREAFRDGLSIDAMAELHGVHRSTVARWVVRAHRGLVRAIRAKLMAELALSRSEVDSLFQLVFSRMEITLGGRVR